MMNSEMLLAEKSYRIIESKANSNMLIQGISGIFGFPFTYIVDGATLFTHYNDMINTIRKYYGREPVDVNLVTKVLKGISNELLFDIAFDKVLGNVPIAGIYFNSICAKTMTWRLGILFTMLSARGEEIDVDRVKDTMIVIRSVFPQVDAFKFSQPKRSIFEKMVSSVTENTEEEYEEKIKAAMKAFDL